LCAETWTLKEQHERKLTAFEMTVLHKSRLQSLALLLAVIHAHYMDIAYPYVRLAVVERIHCIIFEGTRQKAG